MAAGWFVDPQREDIRDLQRALDAESEMLYLIIRCISLIIGQLCFKEIRGLLTPSEKEKEKGTERKHFHR